MRVSRATILVGALSLTTAVAVASCGSSSPGDVGSGASARKLLRETFGGSHKVSSGDIQFSITVVPSGSTVLTAPITIGFGGPFESGSAGHPPESDFAVVASAQGQTGRLSILSTGSTGYITVDGISYELPASSYSKFKSGFSSVSGSSDSSGSSVLSHLGIEPLRWLERPRVVGQASVAGVASTEISAVVNVAALLRDLNTLVRRAGSLGISATHKLAAGLSAAEQAKIAAEIRSPSFTLWTGNSDHTLRKLDVAVTLPVAGKLASELGGLRSARVTLTLSYSDLNQPQRISAPSKLEPYSQLEQKLASVLETIEGGTLLGTSTGSSSNLSSTEQRYSACILKANDNVAKMQKCSALLGGG